MVFVLCTFVFWFSFLSAHSSPRLLVQPGARAGYYTHAAQEMVYGGRSHLLLRPLQEAAVRHDSRESLHRRSWALLVIFNKQK